MHPILERSMQWAASRANSRENGMRTLTTTRQALYYLLLLGFALVMAGAMLGWWWIYIAPLLGVL